MVNGLSLLESAMFSKPAVVLVLDNLSHSATAFSPGFKSSMHEPSVD